MILGKTISGISSASDMPVAWEKMEEESANFHVVREGSLPFPEGPAEAFCSRDSSPTVVIGVSRQVSGSRMQSKGEGESGTLSQCGMVVPSSTDQGKEAIYGHVQQLNEVKVEPNRQKVIIFGER